ncbi:rod shape-determining protein MreC [Treponema sp. J25]|uniref:rod shape-determining protein MreC n=1 Tax=Treponema sp. J25 TaxID=2094121 RepID=UPI001052383D|nr:rod shape-determining protein MreC [Treponema sp. J25]TCW60192.1 rod shape-determining protein MreC [Treponema sp. J25]
MKKPSRLVPTTLYVFVGLTGFSFLLLLFSARSFFVDFREIGFSTFSGVRNIVHKATNFVSETIKSVQELGNLKKEYLALLEKVEEYERIQRDSVYIKRENEQLKELLGFSKTIPYRYFVAEIIGKEPDNLFSSFVVNKGTTEGIKKNMAVIAYQDGERGLVGKVIQVGLHESLVMPIYDSNSFVSSRLLDSRYEGIVNGQGSAQKTVVMRYVKKRAKDEIQIGSMVITSGLSDIYPPDIPIGRVERMIIQDYETSITLELAPVIDFSKLEYVFIVDKGVGGDQ